MSQDKNATSLGRWIMRAKALYDLYGVIVYAAIELDGWIQKRRAEKNRGKQEPEEKPRKKEHPHTARLRRQIEEDRRKREEAERAASDAADDPDPD